VTVSGADAGTAPMLYTPSVIAVLYDVHGNLAALDAVLEDARAAGAEQWVLGGDYALFGAWPAETVARLRELEPAVWIRGNVDRWAGDPTAAPDDEGLQAAIADCRGALGDAVADELGALPFEAELAGARIVHASPVSDLRSFAPAPDPEDEELLDGTTHPRLLFGHTHVQFSRPAASADVELVNPGSVGVPLDGDPRAAYALIHPDRTLELRRVGYDTAAAVAALRETFGTRPWVEMITGRLERSRP
jgi:predicted phosphodiesterase